MIHIFIIHLKIKSDKWSKSTIKLIIELQTSETTERCLNIEFLGIIHSTLLYNPDY